MPFDKGYFHYLSFILFYFIFSSLYLHRNAKMRNKCSVRIAQQNAEHKYDRNYLLTSILILALKLVIIETINIFSTFHRISIYTIFIRTLMLIGTFIFSLFSSHFHFKFLFFSINVQERELPFSSGTHSVTIFSKFTTI